MDNTARRRDPGPVRVERFRPSPTTTLYAEPSPQERHAAWKAFLDIAPELVGQLIYCMPIDGKGWPFGATVVEAYNIKDLDMILAIRVANPRVSYRDSEVRAGYWEPYAWDTPLYVNMCDKRLPSLQPEVVVLPQIWPAHEEASKFEFDFQAVYITRLPLEVLCGRRS